MRKTRLAVATLGVAMSVAIASMTSNAVAAPSTHASSAASGTSRLMSNCAPGLATILAAPDPSVDPATATQAQLKAAGYPPRPTVDTEEWVTEMKKPHTFICPQWGTLQPHLDLPNTSPAIGVTPDALGGSVMNWTGIWAGNADYVDLYNGVSMRWVLPTISKDQGSNAGLSTWTGLGDADTSTDPLVQAGAIQNIPAMTGFAPQWLFWEIITDPCPSGCPEVPVANQPLGAGDTVYVNINYGVEGGKNTAIFWIENDNASGNHVSYFYPDEDIGTTQATQAEWIVERQGLPAVWSGPISLTGASTYDLDVRSDVCAGTQQHQSIHMANNISSPAEEAATQVVYPAAWTDPGTYCNFPVYRTTVK